MARKWEPVHADETKAGLARAMPRSGSKTSRGKKGRTRGKRARRNVARPRAMAPSRIRVDTNVCMVILQDRSVDGPRTRRKTAGDGDLWNQPLSPLTRTPSTMRRLATRKTTRSGRALRVAPAMIGPYDSEL